MAMADGWRVLPLALALTACAGPPPPCPWIELFDGRTLAGWRVTAFGGEGEVAVVDGALRLACGNPLTGLTYAGTPPTGSYDLEVTAARLDGTDFFCGLTFPVRDGHLTLVAGGWGGAVCGLSSLDGEDASRNATCTLRGFETDRDYTFRIEVRTDAVTVWLDDEPFLAADLRGRRLSLRPEVELSRPLGIASFATTARVRSLRWRPRVTAAAADCAAAWRAPSPAALPSASRRRPACGAPASARSGSGTGR